MWTTQPGEANGSLTLRFKGLMQAEDVLRFHPEIQAQLDEIAKKGWKYLFIQVTGTAVSEVKAKNVPCRLRMSNVYAGRTIQPPPILELNFGQNRPDLSGMPEVQEFRINVCSKSFPRAVTVELAKGVVTYIHDAFWKWESSWQTDSTKLSQAREVYEIATWLIEEKEYRLVEAFSNARYQELASQFKTGLK